MIARRVGIGGCVATVLLVVLSACSSGKHAATPSAPSAATSGSAVTASASASGSAPGKTTTKSTTAASGSSATSSVTPSGGSSGGPADGPVPTGFTPYSTTFVTTQDGWALGTAPCAQKPCGSIVRTTDGGASWHGIPAPKATVTGYQVMPAGGVWLLRFADQNNGWAAGRGLYATHDGGRSWKRLAVGPSTGTVTSMGTGGGYVYASIYGCPPSGDGNCPQSSVVYAARIGSDQWSAVSSKYHASAQAAGLVVHGSDWYAPGDTILHGRGLTRATTLPNPCPVMFGHRATPTMAVADTQHLDAMCAGGGAAGSAAYQLYGTTDGGRHWSKAGGSHREGSYLTGVADNAHGVFMMAVASGTSDLLRSTNDGATLTKATVSAPTGGTPWADLGFTTTTQAVVVLQGSGLYFSHDAGRTWSRTTF